MFFTITDVNQAGNEFVANTVTDRTDLFTAGTKFQVRNSTGNDEIYTVVSSSYNGATLETTIVVSEVIADATVDGTINGGIYLLDFSDSAKTPIVVVPTSINNDTSLKLPGYGTLSYGESLLENALHIAENFSDDVAPVNPIEGQHWYESTTKRLHTWTGSEWSTDSRIGSGSLRFTDTEGSDSEIVISGSDSVSPDVGLTLRPALDPAFGASMFRVIDNTGAEWLRVERNGHLETAGGFTASGSQDNSLIGNTGIGIAIPTPGYKLDVNGATNLNGILDVSGGVSFDQTLDVTGVTTLSSVGVSGSATIGTTLSVTGATTMSTLGVAGATSVGSLTTLGTVSAGILEVTNGTNIGGPLTVTDNVTITGVVDVTGATSINGNTDITGTFDVIGATSLTGQLDLNSNRIVNVVDPVNDQDAATKKYVADYFTATAPSLTISSLDDTIITGPAVDDVMLWDGSDWTNRVFAEVAQDAAAISLVNGTHNGIGFTYDGVTRLITADVADFDITVSGAVTGSATVTDLGDVTIDVDYNARDVSSVLATGYTLQLSDAQSHMIFDAPTATTVMIPDELITDFPIGTEIFIRRKGAGLVTVEGDVGVTIESLTTSLELSEINGTARLIKEGTNQWLFSVTNSSLSYDKYVIDTTILAGATYSIDPTTVLLDATNAFDVRADVLIKDTVALSPTFDMYLNSEPVIQVARDATNINVINTSGADAEIKLTLSVLYV